MKTVWENGAGSGVSRTSMRRAVDSLGVKKKIAEEWCMSPPHSPSKGAQHAQPLNVEHLEQVEPKNTAGADAEPNDCEVF